MKRINNNEVRFVFWAFYTVKLFRISSGKCIKLFIVKTAEV